MRGLCPVSGMGCMGGSLFTEYCACLGSWGRLVGLWLKGWECRSLHCGRDDKMWCRDAKSLELTEALRRDDFLVIPQYFVIPIVA
jgi:hypothetical protein